MPGRRTTDAGRVDVAAVAVAALDNFGVAGDDLDARGCGGLGHGVDDGGKLRQRKAFFENETGAQKFRLRAGDGQIVDRSVHGQLADRSAREKTAAARQTSRCSWRAARRQFRAPRHRPDFQEPGCGTRAEKDARPVRCPACRRRRGPSRWWDSRPAAAGRTSWRNRVRRSSFDVVSACAAPRKRWNRRWPVLPPKEPAVVVVRGAGAFA